MMGLLRRNIVLHVHDSNGVETFPIAIGKLTAEYRRKLKRSMHGVQIFDKYNPNEARDPEGKWTEGGGSASSEHPLQKEIDALGDAAKVIHRREQLPGSETREQKYLRFGDVPKSGYSTLGSVPAAMHRAVGIREGQQLSGVSVFKVKYDRERNMWKLDTAELGESGISSIADLADQQEEYSADYKTDKWKKNENIRPIYLLTGKPIRQQGTDGEPLLHGKSIEIVDRLNLQDFYHEGYYDPDDDLNPENHPSVFGIKRTVDKYNPAEARDPTGKWTEGGGSPRKTEGLTQTEKPANSVPSRGVSTSTTGGGGVSTPSDEQRRTNTELAEEQSRAYERRDPGVRGGNGIRSDGAGIVASYHNTEDEAGVSPTFHELKSDTGIYFGKYIQAAKQGKYSACVNVYPAQDYNDMRTFLTIDGGAGFALKEGDDIVSVFRHPNAPKDVARHLLGLSVAQGGRRLDCFDTVLPGIYADQGFRAVARIPFNDEYKPEGWDYETFNKFNKGRPDVVFMVYDPATAQPYTGTEGVKVDSYEAAEKLQKDETARLWGEQGTPNETTPTSVKVRQDNGALSDVPLPPEVVAHARTLKEAPDRYFKTETEGTEMIPVGNLVQTRARPEGIAHAVELMAKAYQGEGGKRGPIHVQKLDDGNYLVLDGNSTTTIATAAGWQHLPAIVIPDASYLPKKEPKTKKDEPQKKTGDAGCDCAADSRDPMRNPMLGNIVEMGQGSQNSSNRDAAGIQQKNTKSWKFLHVHTFDRIFKLRMRDYDPSEARDPAGKWTKGGGSPRKPEEEEKEPDDYEEPAYSDPSEKIAPEYHEPQPEAAKPSDDFTPPKKTVKAYKLFVTKPDKPGRLFPLFIGANESVPLGEWIPGKNVANKLGLAVRPGWHAGALPLAPHLRDKSKEKKIAGDRVWAEVEFPDDVDWQSEADKFGRWTKPAKDKPSRWLPGEIRDRVPIGGYYKYNTKPGQGGVWYIGGAMKVNKVLSDKDVYDLLMARGKPQDAKAETMRTGEFPFKTKDWHWRDIFVHTVDGVFRLNLRGSIRDADFDPTEHPTAPKGTKGKYKGGEFVPKGTGGTKAKSTTTKPATITATSTAQPKVTAPKKPPAATKTDTTVPLKGSKGHVGLISTSQPKDKITEFSQPSFESMKAEPKLYKTNIVAFSNPYGYPLQEDELYGSDEEVGRHIIDHIKSNLKFIYNNTPKEQRDRTKNWYDGARKLVDEHVEKYKKYGLKDMTVAGIYACLSPNNLWDQNVRQADQMIDILLTKQDEPWSPKMDQVVKDKYNPVLQKAAGLIRGKKLKDLADPEDKALWIRTYDQSVNTDAEWNGEKLGYQPFHRITPEGNREEWYLTKKSKKPQGFAWTSLPLMAKAVAIMESNGDRDVISREMGQKHKIRSFYNNILDPNSENDDVTMDTHAIDAAWLMDAPIAVAQNFKNTPMKKNRPAGWIAGASASVKTGNTGTYGIYATAYREVAKDLGVQPRQLQSIVWETKREWLVDIPAESEQAISQVWDQYREGKYTIAQAQNQVKKLVDEAADKKVVREESTPEDESDEDEDK